MIAKLLFVAQAAAQDAAGSANGASESSAQGADETLVEVGPVDVSAEGLFTKLQSWADGAIALLPNIAIAIVFFVVVWLFAGFVKYLLVRWANRRNRASLGDVLGGFIKAIIIVFGGMLALTIVLPNLNPADLIAALGVGSVAIGFAFKDILQNWLAGLLILIRQPFKTGDQIVISGFEGTVDHIETRVTAIRTYDGQLALIPNSDVYTDAVLVKTAYKSRRHQYDVGIGYADSIDESKKVILAAVRSVGEVLDDPAPDVLVVGLDASWVTLRPRWWTGSTRKEEVTISSDVIEAIKKALDAAGIDMPYTTEVHLFHDQSEEADGDRTAQREGWPAGDNPPKPRRPEKARSSES